MSFDKPYEELLIKKMIEEDYDNHLCGQLCRLEEKLESLAGKLGWNYCNYCGEWVKNKGHTCPE